MEDFRELTEKETLEINGGKIGATILMTVGGAMAAFAGPISGVMAASVGEVILAGSTIGTIGKLLDVID